MVKIAEENNRGLFLTVVVILAFAIFAGALRSIYAETEGYATYGRGNFGSNNNCAKPCITERDMCARTQRQSLGSFRSVSSIPTVCQSAYKDCLEEMCA